MISTDFIRRWGVGVACSMAVFAIWGWFHFGWVGSHFQTPQRLSEKEWDWKTSSNQHSASVGREAYISDGRLTIAPFQRLSYFKKVDLRAIDLEMDSDSGIGIFHIAGQNRQSDLALGSSAYGLQPKAVADISTHGVRDFRIDLGEQSSVLSFANQSVSLNTTSADTVQGTGTTTLIIEASDKPVHIRRLSLLGPQNKAFFASDFPAMCTLPSWQRFGSLFGAGFGLIFWVLVRRPQRLLKIGVPLLIAALPAVLVSLWPLSLWMSWVERLYLVDTKDWELARMGVAFSMIPLFAACVLFSGFGWTDSEKDTPSSIRNWVSIVTLILAVIALISSDVFKLNGGILAFGVFGLLFPIFWWGRKGISMKAVLLREWPVYALIIVFDIGLGLFLGLVWRMGIVASSAGRLRHRHASATVTYLLVCLLSLPIALEVAARQTYLNRTWVPERLSLDYSSDDPQRFIEPYWSDSCGVWEPPGRQTVLFMGGSSTGNNQYKPKAAQMFTALVHDELCLRVGENQGIATYNYGRGGLDSHILARSLSTLFEQRQPDLMILYMGVNDLLARDSSLSKGQQEIIMNQWRAQLKGIQKFTSRSRLLIGGSLLARRIQKSKTKVPNVPLAEAKLNFERIVQTAQQNDVTLLLSTEYVRPDLEALSGKGETLSAYAAMQATLAKENDGVEFIDIQSQMRAFSKEQLLYDTNHLNPRGYLRVSQLFRPRISTLLEQRRLR